MIRTGVYRLEQIKNNQLLDLFGKEKNISLKIYHDLDGLADETGYEKYSEIILNRFNTNSNAIKRTYRNRFNAFDDLVVQTVKEQDFPTVKMHDMAVSDGRASCYILIKMSSAFAGMEYQGSDLAMFYKLYQLDKDAYVITNELNEIIEITRPPFVWNYAREEGRIYFINNRLKEKYKNKYAALLKTNGLKDQSLITLADKEYKSLISQHKNYKIVNYNLFEKSSSVFNVIRVMNILHYGYFNDDQLKTILQHVFNALASGGLFIEGSNEDAGSGVEGAIYKKTATGFERLKQGEKPSRIEKAVLSFETSATLIQ